MPGMVASMLVNAIRVPAKLGARSAWLENTPEYMLARKIGLDNTMICLGCNLTKISERCEHSVTKI